MNFISLLLLCLQAVSADLIAWNRYSGLIAKKNMIESEQDLISHQDAIIQQLVKRNNYAELRAFIQLVRQSHNRYRQKRMFN